jgi:hypothetical protein
MKKGWPFPTEEAEHLAEADKLVKNEDLFATEEADNLVEAVEANKLDKDYNLFETEEADNLLRLWKLISLLGMTFM